MYLRLRALPPHDLPAAGHDHEGDDEEDDHRSHPDVDHVGEAGQGVGAALPEGAAVTEGMLEVIIFVLKRWQAKLQWKSIQDW